MHSCRATAVRQPRPAAAPFAGFHTLLRPVFGRFHVTNREQVLAALLIHHLEVESVRLLRCVLIIGLASRHRAVFHTHGLQLA